MTTPSTDTSPRAFPLRLTGIALAAAALIFVPAPAFAQDSGADARIRKIEAEVRALQRKVFPGGDGKFFEPQIAPGSSAGSQVAVPAATQGIGVPSTTAVTDILVRLDALETQLRGLTARSEEQANGLAQLELRIAAIETGSAPQIIPATGSTGAPAVLVPVGAAPAPLPASLPAPSPAPAPAPIAAPSPARLAAVQAIAKPQTADAADDEYSFGFRLWSAGFFPEARQQLTKYVEQYPTHSRISYGRNLLGRAFLDDKMPEEAARWFLRNYQASKTGERAADSLLYLGASMIAMKDTKRACIALAEFADTYPVIAAGRLATDYQSNRAKVTCS